MKRLRQVYRIIHPFYCPYYTINHKYFTIIERFCYLTFCYIHLLRPPKYYLPTIHQVMQRQVFPFQKPFYVKLDLKNAFFNLPIHPKSRYITTFHYGEESFRFCKMPFGLSLAPYVQQMMSVPIATIFRCFGIRVDDLIAAHEDKYYLFVCCAYVCDRLRRSSILNFSIFL